MSRVSVFACIASLAIGVAYVEPLRADAAPIYRCELKGQLIFSDQPCGGVAQPLAKASSQVNVYEHQKYERKAAATTPNKRTSERAAERRARADIDLERNRVACTRVANSIDRIHSKQRAGYRAKAGVRMDERLRELEEERRARRCR